MQANKQFSSFFFALETYSLKPYLPNIKEVFPHAMATAIYDSRHGRTLEYIQFQLLVGQGSKYSHLVKEWTQIDIDDWNALVKLQQSLHMLWFSMPPADIPKKAGRLVIRIRRDSEILRLEKANPIIKYTEGNNPTPILVHSEPPAREHTLGGLKRMDFARLSRDTQEYLSRDKEFEDMLDWMRANRKSARDRDNEYDEDF